MGGQAPMGSRFFISSGQMNCPSGNCRLGRQFYALRAGRWRSRGKQQISLPPRIAQGHRPLRDDGGNGVFINDLLLSIAGQHYSKGVKSGDIAPHLKAVHQKHGDGPAVPADLGQEDLLKVVGFLHDM